MVYWPDRQLVLVCVELIHNVVILRLPTNQMAHFLIIVAHYAVWQKWFDRIKPNFSDRIRVSDLCQKAAE